MNQIKSNQIKSSNSPSEKNDDLKMVIEFTVREKGRLKMESSVD